MLKLYLNDHVCWRHIQLKRRRFINRGTGTSDTICIV